MRLKRLTCSTFILSGLLSAVASAAVPVVESTPVVTNVETAVSNSAPVSTASVQITPQAPTGTAHLLLQMDEMRQEIMTLRGQLEEQAYQINQIKQENRDRYLDLDQRISRFVEGGSPVSLKSAVSSAVAPVTNVTDVAAPVVDHSAKEEAGYQAAFLLIKEKRFDDALVAMRKLLQDFPRGTYSDNAQYWLGEIQMAQGKYAEAKTEFLAVINDYPGSSKVADAAYKLGRVYDLLGEKTEAKKRLESVVSKYPGTTAARLSDTYLRNM